MADNPMADPPKDEQVPAQEPAAGQPGGSNEPAIPTRNRRKLFVILAIVLVAAGLIWFVWHRITQSGRVSTDNAYVGAETAQVTPLVAGNVVKVLVSGTQTVKTNDILVVLDDTDARLALTNAESALAQAQQRYRQATAGVSTARSQAVARTGDIEQAQARLASASAEVNRTAAELARRQSLGGTGAVSGEELTSARTAYAAARAARDQAAAAVQTARATRDASIGQVEQSAAVIQGTTIGTAPDVRAAQSQVELARLNLARTVIRAPINGVVTNRTVQVGQRVAAGTPIMTLVPIAQAYVDANFKENQLAQVRPGQPVELTSDYYGGDVVFHGKVVGFAGGTGAAFALIPAQNATGNWIKVVQRLPVRIALDPKELAQHPLRVGLSMDATIDTRGR
ncbi:MULTISPECIES: efflux RND transporter periplasmic adaptor subunit [Sphingomonas]|uniref:efflux RND transporter periplasmic adaptor subunit n=1 Tax=Sphingomonas TaxID=13687 RepID=UPI001966AE25|nr:MULTISPECIES: HlyD family secretion protein [Sphingomonas]